MKRKLALVLISFFLFLLGVTPVTVFLVNPVVKVSASLTSTSALSSTTVFQKGIELAFKSHCSSKSYKVTPLGKPYPLLTNEEVGYLQELNPDFVIISVTGPGGWYNIAKESPYQDGHQPTDWNNPYYDFEPLDEVIELLSENGIEPFLQMWGTPVWANGVDYERLGRGCFDFMDHGPVPPNNLEEYGLFMRAVAERYNGRHGFPWVNRFLLWNEPNLPSFWTGTVEQFVEMNNFAYDQIKVVNPEAEIWGGNTAPCCSGPTPVDWLTQAHGFGFKFDKFGHHAYPVEWTIPPWDQPEGEKDRIPPNYLQRLVEHLDSLSGYEGKHIVVTESGYRLELGITPEQQAEWLEWSMSEANKNPRVDGWTHFLLHYHPEWWTGPLEGITGYQPNGVWASSQYDNELTKEKAIDFDENTFWSSIIFWNPYVAEWLTVELESSKEINQIIVCPHVVDGEIFSFPKDFSLGYSDDGNDWHIIETFTDYQPTMNEDGGFCQVFSFPKINHRYFAIGATKLSVMMFGNYVFQIAEFRLRKVDETSKLPVYHAFRDWKELEGDLNKDGSIDSQDIKILLRNWGSSPSIPEADLNSDGIVNGIDFGEMVRLIQ